MTSEQPVGFTHAPKVWATVVYFASLAVFVVIFAGRKPGPFRFEWVIDRAPGFYTHASNLSLSYFLVCGIGYVWLMRGAGPRQIALLAGVLVVANVVVEAIVSVLNVPDWVDAVFGVAGSGLAAFVLWAIWRWGLRPTGTPQG